MSIHETINPKVVKEILNIKTHDDLVRMFSDESKCYQYLEAKRWPNGVKCPYCKSGEKIWVCANHRYKCGCGKLFSVRSNTCFARSNLRLQIWFSAIWRIANCKRGISSIELAQHIGVTQKTAWFLLHRIRNAMITQNNATLSNTVECDETYIHEEWKNRRHHKKHLGNKGRSLVGKSAAWIAVERGGKAVARKIDSTSSKALLPLVLNFTTSDATLMTDEWTGYVDVHKYREHYIVNHGRKQYADGPIHSNTAESLNALLKRMLYTYYSVSYKHLGLYLNEWMFRVNLRQKSFVERFDAFFEDINYTVKYKDLTYGERHQYCIPYPQRR
ncbi:MAG: IS1595 family transposase [Alistipes sp.]|nr:IS1595 family transposase [Alistipes sp.]